MRPLWFLTRYIFQSKELAYMRHICEHWAHTELDRNPGPFGYLSMLISNHPSQTTLRFVIVYLCAPSVKKQYCRQALDFNMMMISIWFQHMLIYPVTKNIFFSKHIPLENHTHFPFEMKLSFFPIETFHKLLKCSATLCYPFSANWISYLIMQKLNP